MNGWNRFIDFPPIDSKYTTLSEPLEFMLFNNEIVKGIIKYSADGDYTFYEETARGFRKINQEGKASPKYWRLRNV